MHGLTTAVRRLGVPGPIAFVLIGLVLSVAAPPLRVLVTPELVLVVLLPGLVFEAAYRLHWDDLRRAYGSIAFLAVPGVLISAAIVAFGLTLTTGLRPELAFVAGAIVSATDPAAVVATFTKLQAPARLVAALGALIFLAVGLAIGQSAVLSALGPIAWGVLAVLVARAVVVYGLIGGALLALGRRRGAPNLPARWLHPLFWAGLRGGVATAAALSLPLDFPERDLLQRIAFGVVFVTLLVQGTTAAWVVRWTAPSDQPASTLRTT